MASHRLWENLREMVESLKLEVDPSAKVLLSYMHICGKVGMYPYRWSWRKQRVVYRSEFRYNIGTYLTTGLGILYGLFTGIQVIRSFSEDWTLSSKTRLYFILNGGFFAMTGALLNMSNFGKHHSVLNQVLGLGNKLKASKNEVTKTASSGPTWALCSIFFIHMMLMLTNPLRVFSDPNDPSVLSSFLSNSQSISKGIRICLYLVQLSLVIGLTSQTFLFLSIIIYYCHILKLTTAKLSFRASIQRDFQEYRKLMVMQVLFQNYFGSWLLVLIGFGISMIILTFYQAVCFRDVRSLVFCAVLFRGYFYLIKIGGDIDTASENVIKGWGGIRRSDDQGPWIRSCKPVRLQAGSFFYLDRGFYLTFLDVVIKNAITLILYTYKK